MIESRDHRGVRVLSMAHGKANTLDIEFLAALQNDLQLAADADHIEAVVLTGTGNIFSAGVDLFRIVDGGPAYLEQFLPALSNVITRLFSLPKPVVAAVNGHAIAGGCILACACDVRIGVRGRARIGVPELRVGVPFPAAALEIVRFAVGTGRLSEVVLGGATYPPEKALKIGLLDRLSDPEDLSDSALENALDLAAVGARAFAFSKQQIRGDIARAVQRKGERTDSKVLEMWGAPETQAKIRVYLDRTLSRR